MTVNRIKVTCEEPAHEGKVATVCQFVRVRTLPPGVDDASPDYNPDEIDDADLIPVWHMRSRGTPPPERRTKPLLAYATTPDSPVVAVRLSESGQVVSGWIRTSVEVDHETLHIRCPLCAKRAHHQVVKDVRDVQVRQDRLNVICDTLAAAGVSSISLCGLGARVNNEQK